MIHHVFVLLELTLFYLLLLKWMVCNAYVKYGGFVPGISFPLFECIFNFLKYKSVCSFMNVNFRYFCLDKIKKCI